MQINSGTLGGSCNGTNFLEQKHALVRVFVKGGIISPGDFLKIITTAQELGTEYVHFGSRQDLLFPSPPDKREALDQTFRSIEIDYDCDGENFQNIVSSYVALDVMPHKPWLAPHIYHYVLDTFDYKPKLKINITDPAQSLVPLFTGNLNFVASNVDNYWYLYLRFAEIEPKPWCLPILIYGYDMAKAAALIEKMMAEHQVTYEQIYERIKADKKINSHPIAKPLEYTEEIFPYYEGMNRIDDGKYWLGLYWRNNQFSIPFLKAMCEICLKTKVGKISFTPWKSFIVKGISEKDKVYWEKLLGTWGINMRHSHLELNWHLPVLDQESLELKNYLVRALDQQDISTYGLTFTIKTRDLVPFTSVVIERNASLGAKEKPSYNILYAKDFNPNSFEHLYFAKNVNKEIIPPLLIDLSRLYYEQLSQRQSIDNKSVKRNLANSPERKVYQCRRCLTLYDETFGDEQAGIKKGTSFQDLPSTYCCTLCGSPKEDFVLMA